MSTGRSRPGNTEPGEDPNPRVVIVGGGLAGLAAAWELVKEGHRVTIYEKRHRLGGKAGSERVELPGKDVHDGGEAAGRRSFYSDHGYHVFPIWYDNVITLMGEVGVEYDDLAVPGERFVSTWGSLNGRRRSRPDPRNPGPAWFGQLRLLYSILDLITTPDDRLETRRLDEFLEERGHERSKLRYESLALKAFAIHSDEVSALSVARMFRRWFTAAPITKRCLDAQRQAAVDAVLVAISGGSRPVAEEANDHAGARFGTDERRMPTLPTEVRQILQELQHVDVPTDPAERRLVVEGVVRSHWMQFEPRKVHRGLLRRVPLPRYLIRPGWSALAGSLQRRLIDPIKEGLEDAGGDRVELECGTEVIALHLEDGEKAKRERITAITVRNGDSAERRVDITGPLVLAVPADVLKNLLDDGHAPELTDLLTAGRLLETRPLAAIDVHVTKRIEGLPRDHFSLTDSALNLTAYDISPVWPRSELPAAATSDARVRWSILQTLAARVGWLAAFPETFDGEPFRAAIADDRVPERIRPQLVELAARPETWNSRREGRCRDDILVELVLGELMEHFDLGREDIDIEMTRACVHLNFDAQVFMNKPDTLQHRPRPSHQKVRNLFVAGDYCYSSIDIASMESAVGTGKIAAAAILDRTPILPAIDLRWVRLVLGPLRLLVAALDRVLGFPGRLRKGLPKIVQRRLGHLDG